MEDKLAIEKVKLELKIANEEYGDPDFISFKGVYLIAGIALVIVAIVTIAVIASIK